MQTATMNEIDVVESVDTDCAGEENTTDDLGKENQKSRFVHLRAKGFTRAC